MNQPAEKKLGKYVLGDVLGKGAMGVVYKAWDPVLERDVAIKVMASSIVSDQELKGRFETEAKAVAKLQHPNIVTIHDLGYDQQGAPWFAMEYLKGDDLEKLMRKKPPGFVQKLEIMAQVCRGLAYAHENQIVHRDIKPANIHVAEKGSVKIMDFGVARLQGRSQTQTGAVLGTADYMSPEQIQGEKIDGRSDIFSAGVILYRLLTREKPFKGENISAVFYKIINSDAPELLLPDGNKVPELQAIVDRAMAKGTDMRYQSAEQMAEDLSQFLRKYHGALAEDTVFETSHDPGAAVDFDSSGRTRRPTLRTGAPAPASTAGGGVSATRGSVGATATPHTVAPGAGGTIQAPTTHRPTTVLPATRVARPGVRPARPAPPRRSVLPLVVVGLLVLVAAGAGGVYWYMTKRPARVQTADLTARFEFADAAFQNGRLSQSFEAVENILALSPNNQRALELKEQIRQALEKQEQPEPPPPPPTVPSQPVQPAGPSNAQKAQALVADAGLAIGGKDVEHARSLISEGQQLDPSNPRWSRLERQVASLERELEQKSIEERKAQIIAGYLTQATQAIGAEDYDRAIAAYEEILKQDPNHAGAVTGKAQAVNLRRQVERVAAARHIIHSKTEFVAPPGQGDGPKGFEAGGVQVKAATRAARFPGELIIELNPTNAQPGNPYVLRIRVANQGNRPVHVKSLEIVSTYSGKSTGKGQQIATKVRRIDPRATGLLHEVDGTWTEEQNKGRITAIVTLVGGAKLTKTISW